IIDMPNNPKPTLTIVRLKEKIKLSQKAVCPIGFHFGTNGKNLPEFPAAAKHPHVFGLKLYCNHTTGEMLIEDINLLAKVFAAWPKGKPILVHAEAVQLAAVIGLTALYNQRLHVCHISQAVEVELVRRAKKAGLKVTAGVTPHHLFLPFNSALMKPLLGGPADQKELWRGLKDGTIDLVESDHAPHTKAEKRGPKSAFGVPGLETTFGLMLLAVKQKKVKLNQVRRWLYDNPKKIFKIPSFKTKIKFDPDKFWIVEDSALKTKCGWSPFKNWKLYGKVMV
ncbi:MAG: dihydroorotase, partial [Patescibacteria group bacterium]|nr:dihydroorotase [Patescibacteria group bacterium]